MKIDFSTVHTRMHQAVAQGVFPGGVLLVSRDGNLMLHEAYGAADLFRGRPMTRATVFDLASLTKPLATTLAAMCLVQQQRLDLDRPVCDYWTPFCGQGKERISVRHLMSHCSGLPAWRPYYLHLAGISPQQARGMYQEAVAAEPLAAAPGEWVDYSDLGFMVLQWVVEQVAAQPLDRFACETIYQPLGLPLFFSAIELKGPDLAYAATELCPLRGRLLVGQVHDDNAYALGGIAGHAGLFGTADAVWMLLQALLWAVRGQKEHPLFERKWLQAVFEKQNSRWCLGFDTPAEKESSAGHFFTPGSVGHLGYTGCSFWMDPAQGIIVILLTNRVHPCRYNTAIKRFRPFLHDTIMAALGAAGDAWV